MPEVKNRCQDSISELSRELHYSHVRIYVSSVFQDKHFERQIINKLAPYFRNICERLGFQFQLIDLRFEMNDEVINDILVAQLCRQEVAYSRDISLGPGLVILAGMRYGFRPLPETLSREDAHSLTGTMDDNKAKTLFFDWFRVDANSLTNDYNIVPVSARYKHFFSHDTKSATFKNEERLKWQIENQVVGRSLRRAAKTVFKNDKPKLNAITSSIFESEIFEGLLSHHGNPNDHCLCFKTKIIDINKFLFSHDSVTKYIDVIIGTKEIDQDAQKALNALKELKIPQDEIGIGTENIFEHKLVFGQDLIDTSKSESFKEYLSDFENSFKESVTKLIQKCIPKIPNILSSCLSNEVNTHLEFARHMSLRKWGFHNVAEKCVACVNTYINGTFNSTPLVLYGEQGCGKTAVISRAVERIFELSNIPEIGLVVRFVGLTLGAQSICPLLRSVCEQLLFILGLTNQNPPHEYTKLKAYFNRLILEPTNRKLVILLDGVDYLDDVDNGASVDWLPRFLPENVRLVVTTRPEVNRLSLSGARAVMRNSGDSFLELTPIPSSELSPFLSSFLSAHNRKLTSSQFQIVLSFMRSSSCVTPFYVSLLMKDAIKWKSFSKVDQSELSVSVNGMVHSIFAKLEQKFSKNFVTECLSIITVARFGITECELEELLSANLELRESLSHKTNWNQRISPIYWARLKLELSFPFLVHVSAPGSYCVIRWGHSIFRNVAQKRYLSTSDKTMHYHKLLSEFHLNSKLINVFQLEPSVIGPSDLMTTKECPYFNPRNMLELPLNLIETRQTRVLIGLLTDLDWLRLKIESIGIFELLRDFALLFEKLPSSEESDLIRQLRILRECMLNSYNSIGRNPDCLPQKLTNHLMAFVFQGDPIQESSLKLRNPDSDIKYSLLIGLLKSAMHSLMPPALIPLSPSNEHIGTELMYEFCNHKDAITCIRIKETNCHKGMLVMTSSKDCTVRLWELKTGRLLLVFVGHDEGVNCCDISLSATLAISGSTDATIRLWNTNNASCLQQLNGHIDSVNSVAITKNGRVGVSAGSDGKICIWNCHQVSSCFGDLIYTIQAHNRPIRCLALLQDDRHIVSGSDDTLVKVWNVASSRNSGTMKGHTGPVVSVSVLDNIILSSSSDGTVKTWSKDCTLLQTIPANSYTINSVHLSHTNGMNGLLGSSSGKLLVIDPLTGISKNSIAAHSCSIQCVTMTTDGMWGVSGDENGTIKIWQIGTELSLEGFRTTKSHEGLIGRLRFSPCEQFLVTVGADGYVSIIDLESRKEELTLWAHSQPISDVVIHKDSVRFLTAGEDRKLKLWHGENARAICEFDCHLSPLSCVAITEEGELIASGDKMGNIFLWRIDEPDWKVELESELTESISELQFVYKNSIAFLLVGCQDGSVTLWNVNQAVLVHKFNTPEGVTCLDTISHEWQAICGTQSGSLYKWRLGESTPLKKNNSIHKDVVTGIRYLNKLEPRYIVSSSLDGCIYLLDSKSLIRLASFCSGDCITSIDANLAGNLVAFGSICGTVGMVGVSYNLQESNPLFESGPYLFKQSERVDQFGEYTQSLPMLTDNLDNGSGLLEFSDQFEAVTESANENRAYHKEGELEPIYLVPRRQGVLWPISESSDEDINGTKRTNKIEFQFPINPNAERNLNNNSEQVTSTICNII